MTYDDEIERRLRAVMNHEAGRVDPDQVADRLSVETVREHADVRPTGRRYATALLAAAAVAAIATGAVLLGTSGHDERSTPTVGAPHEQTASATPAGSITYVKVSDGVARDQIETWIPADRSQTWQLNQANFSETQNAQQRAKCAAFPYMKKGVAIEVLNRKPMVLDPGYVPNCDQGDWGYYRPKFFDALPDDPASVLASMRKGSVDPRDVSTFFTGYDTVSRGTVQPAAVEKIVAALKLLPGTTTSRDGDTETIHYSGRIKSSVLQSWALTLDQGGSRVVAATESDSGGKTTPYSTTITYKTVDRLGER